MAYGNLKVDSLIYDNSGSDVTVSISALAGAGSVAPINNPSFTGNATFAGNIVNGTFADSGSSSSGEGIRLGSSGQISLSRAIDTAPLFKGYTSAGAVSSQILGNGSATYAGTISSGTGVGSGVGVQLYSDGTIQSWNGGNINTLITSSGSATFAGAVTAGSYKTPAQAVGALDIDLATGNYFTKTINGNSTFTFSNPPTSGTTGSFTLELTHTSGTVTWPASVKWPADTAPTLTAGKTHLFIFVTDDGGTRYRGAALADYVN